MSKIKMRCTSCGKWFQSANAKETVCYDCVQKARREKLASKSAPPPGTPGQSYPGQGNPQRTPPPPPPRPKPAQGGTSHWFDTVQDVKVGQPDTPPQRPRPPASPAQQDSFGPGGYRERGPGGPGGYREGNRGPGGYREGGNRGPGGYREGGPGGYRGPGSYDSPGGYRPRQSMEGGFGRGPRPGGGPGTMEPRREKPPKAQKPKPKKAPTPPKPKREKIPPPQPFVPTPEQVAMVEARYQELANPAEFDGIRTQISKELSIPKKAVKKIIKEYRERNQIPSWWEVQTYRGSSEELEKIKAAYLPYLPVPPVGVHKTIAEQLDLKASTVYQAIKAIRLEMNLPQFNDPSTHPEMDKKKELPASTTEVPGTPSGETQDVQPEKEMAASTTEDPGTLPGESVATPNVAEPVEAAAAPVVEGETAGEQQ